MKEQVNNVLEKEVLEGASYFLIHISNVMSSAGLRVCSSGTFIARAQRQLCFPVCPTDQ